MKQNQNCKTSTTYLAIGDLSELLTRDLRCLSSEVTLVSLRPRSPPLVKNHYSLWFHSPEKVYTRDYYDFWKNFKL